MTSHSHIVQNVKEKYTKNYREEWCALEVKVGFINYYMIFEMTWCVAVDCSSSQFTWTGNKKFRKMLWTSTSHQNANISYHLNLKHFKSCNMLV